MAFVPFQQGFHPTLPGSPATNQFAQAQPPVQLIRPQINPGFVRPDLQKIHTALHAERIKRIIHGAIAGMHKFKFTPSIPKNAAPVHMQTPHLGGVTIPHFGLKKF